MSGAGHLPQLGLRRFGPRHCCRDFSANERLVFHRALLAFALPHAVSFMLPKGDRCRDAVPSLYGAPYMRVRIGNVDPIDVPRIIAQIQQSQTVTPGEKRPEPVLEIVDGEQADALWRGPLDLGLA